MYETKQEFLGKIAVAAATYKRMLHDEHDRDVAAKYAKAWGGHVPAMEYAVIAAVDETQNLAARLQTIEWAWDEHRKKLEEERTPPQ